MYIKREDAIKAIEEWAVNLGNPKMLVREDAILVLKDIPSAENKGEWMPIIEANEFGEVYQSGIYCSECGETLGCEANYCPNCGARMK